jgi:hypothetical protein
MIPMKVLAIDIGGTNVKALVTGAAATERRKAPSGPKMTPQKMVAAVKELAKGWDYDVISIGYPGLTIGMASLQCVPGGIGSTSRSSRIDPARRLRSGTNTASSHPRANPPLPEDVHAPLLARSPRETPAARTPAIPRTDSPRCPARTSSRTACTRTPPARTSPSPASPRPAALLRPGTTFI